MCDADAELVVNSPLTAEFSEKKVQRITSVHRLLV